MGLKVILEAVDKEKYIKYIIDSASNGMEAFTAVKSAIEMEEHEYGLIFMDCSMPVLDGYEATDRIR